MHRTLRATLSLLILASVSACVTEVERPRGRGSPFRTADTSSIKQDKSGTPGAATAGIVQSADARSSSARVQVAVAPLGAVVYDALTLPLVSPNGRYLVAQQGVAPGWDELLATDAAAPRSETRLLVHEVGPRALTPLTTGQDHQAGLLLGRDADNEGFLVESVRADGARWIGRCDWTTGRVSWLASGEAVYSHGALLSDGSLVCARRAIGDWRASLVLRPGDARESVASLDNASLLYPTPVPDGSAVVCIAAIADGTLELVAFAITGEHSASQRMGDVLARRSLGRFDDPVVAYQVFAPLQPSAWSHPGAQSARSTIVFTHPGTGRATWFDIRRGQFLALADRSVAGVVWHDASVNSARDGFLCTMPDELAFVTAPTPGAAIARPVRVLAGPWVARVVGDASTPELILLGPDRSRGDRIEVVRARIGTPTTR